MLIEAKEKIHVIQRRAFESDVRRHFIGQVTAVGNEAVRAKGYVFIFDKSSNRYFRLPDLRTRIVSLTDASLIINILPDNANIQKATYTVNDKMRLVVTDGETFSLDINEFGSAH